MDVDHWDYLAQSIKIGIWKNHQFCIWLDKSHFDLLLFGACEKVAGLDDEMERSREIFTATEVSIWQAGKWIVLTKLMSEVVKWKIVKLLSENGLWDKDGVVHDSLHFDGWVGNSIDAVSLERGRGKKVLKMLTFFVDIFFFYSWTLTVNHRWRKCSK
jgi:hypothetical protein